ncbi:hypothetical protein FRIGORI9N_70128 [Frigoribacterium sp. 9N]|nr:hypothetical protein FRIGORI9N_70128 [Frigoribacterium sp. 9N]
MPPAHLPAFARLSVHPPTPQPRLRARRPATK